MLPAAPGSLARNFAMKILSHRGCWKTSDERNTMEAFARSFDLGFGTETDVRDWNGRLVISHDPPTGSPLPLETFLEIYRQRGPGLPLALNIKADGLPNLLGDALAAFDVTNYFVFDMSVPDTLGYLQQGLPVFTRQSEYEPNPPLYAEARGVWMDCFRGDWIHETDVARHLDAGKQVCLVSPDLHKRPHQDFWNALAGWNLKAAAGDALALCTDFPEAAREHFHARD